MVFSVSSTDFLSIENSKGVLCYVNEVTLVSHLRMELVACGIHHLIRGLGLSIQTFGKQGGWMLDQSLVANELISHA